MIGITEIPPATNQLGKILDMLRDNGAYIIIPNKNYNKMEKQYNKILGVKNNKLTNNFFMVRSIPIYKKDN